MGQKEHFWPKTAKFWSKSRKREFSPKIRNVTNLSFMDAQLHAKNQKKYSAVLAAEPERKDALTDALTDPRTGVNLKVPSGV